MTDPIPARTGRMTPEEDALASAAVAAARYPTNDELRAAGLLDQPQPPAKPRTAARRK